MPFENDFLRLLLVVLLVKFLYILWKKRQRRQEKQKKKGPPREWQPKNPKKCPACQAGICLPVFHLKREVTPWSHLKSNG